MVADEAFAGADWQVLRCETRPDVAFTMAFQPIVDFERKAVVAQEALLRGSCGEPASEVLAQVTDAQRFDQACRAKAVELAGRLFPEGVVSINLMAAALEQAEASLAQTLAVAQRHGLGRQQLIFEVSESDSVLEPGRFAQIADACERLGVRLAIDHFGSGHSGLTLLHQFRPQYIKLDMSLVRDLHRSRVRRLLVKCIQDACREVGCEAIAEGVETREELLALRDLGVRLLQGFYFARPAFEAPGLVPAHFLALT